jgi:FkbM family methyltransferase
MIIKNSEHDSGPMALKALTEVFEVESKESIYLDIGAGLPEFYSNSLTFRNHLGVVISIDANPTFCEMFRDKGWIIHNYAITIDETESVTFREYQTTIHKGMSFSSIADWNGIENGLEYSEYKVDAITLPNFIKKEYPNLKEIDVIDIDIEGRELEILNTIDLNIVKVIIVENLGDKKENLQWYEDKGFEVYAKCGHNDIIINKNKI